jgi:hypothetical protein
MLTVSPLQPRTLDRSFFQGEELTKASEECGLLSVSQRRLTRHPLQKTYFYFTAATHHTVPTYHTGGVTTY